MFRKLILFLACLIAGGIYLKTTPKKPTGVSTQITHDTSGIVQISSHRLGEITQKHENHPELSHQSLEFYHSCASGENYPSSVRVLCYSKLKQLDPKHDYSQDPAIPSFIKDLAEQLN